MYVKVMHRENPMGRNRIARSVWQSEAVSTFSATFAYSALLMSTEIVAAFTNKFSSIEQKRCKIQRGPSVLNKIGYFSFLSSFFLIGYFSKMQC